jgi:hypothetical protein
MHSRLCEADIAVNNSTHKKQLAMKCKVNSTGVSYFAREKGMTMQSESCCIPLGPLRSKSSAVRGSEACKPSRDARAWSVTTFTKTRPAGRQEARELRTWLRQQLDKIESKSRRDHCGALEYAENVVDVYNTAFHELTRQVCLHRSAIRSFLGMLMKTVEARWQLDYTTKILNFTESLVRGGALTRKDELNS